MKDKFLTKNMKNPGTGKEQIMCSEAEVIKAGKAVLGGDARLGEPSCGRTVDLYA